MKGKDKKNILPGAAAASLVAAVLVFCVMLNVEKQVLSPYEKGTVLIARENIARGERVDETDAAKYFEEVQMDKELIPAAAVTEQGLLKNSVTASDIDAGSVLTASMLTDMNETAEEMDNPVIAGFKAEDLYQVVSGTLRTGDRIHIYMVEEEPGSITLGWQDVLVAQVFDSSGNEIAAGDSAAAAARVNILMDRENVKDFYSELSRGSLRVVKVYR